MSIANALNQESWDGNNEYENPGRQGRRRPRRPDGLNASNLNSSLWYQDLSNTVLASPFSVHVNFVS